MYHNVVSGGSKNESISKMTRFRFGASGQVIAAYGGVVAPRSTFPMFPEILCGDEAILKPLWQVFPRGLWVVPVTSWVVVVTSW